MSGNTVVQIIRNLKEKLSHGSFDGEFFPEFSDSATISLDELLSEFSKYCGLQKNATSIQRLNDLFWDTIRDIGTPIIENIPENQEEVRVCFLFPRSNYNHEGNNLYVAGDYHGFGSTREKQQMQHLAGTDVMYRMDNIPKGATVTYNFVQVATQFHDKERAFFSGPTEAQPRSFYAVEELPRFTPPTLDGKSPFDNAELFDEFSKHKNLPCSHPGMAMFCASTVNDVAYLKLAPNWIELLGATASKFNSTPEIHLKHRGTYLCLANESLVEDTDIKGKYPDKLYHDAEHTRSVSVFEPKSSKVENLVIFNDGIGYISTNILDRLEGLIASGKIPANTAFIFISPAKGLKTKYNTGHDADIRMLEYGTQVDDYANFIKEKLLPSLGYESILASNRSMVGSSMSGTASIYMGLKYPELVGNIFALAPSYSNRSILLPLVEQRKEKRRETTPDNLKIKFNLSCGTFDSLPYAQNLYMAHTEELAQILGTNEHPLPIHKGPFGHLITEWSRELESTLPNAFKPIQKLPAFDLFKQKEDTSSRKMPDTPETFQNKQPGINKNKL